MIFRLVLAPPACKAANSPPFSTPPAPADPLSPPSAVVPCSDSPTAETTRTTSCTKPPHPAPSHTTPPPPLSSETALPIPSPPPSALAPAFIPLSAWLHFLTCAPYLLYTISLIPLHPPPRSLPLSPASIAPLAVTSTAPAISWLSEHLPSACKADKTLLLNAFKLFAMAVPYLLSFGWG